MAAASEDYSLLTSGGKHCSCRQVGAMGLSGYALAVPRRVNNEEAIGRSGGGPTQLDLRIQSVGLTCGTNGHVRFEKYIWLDPAQSAGL